MKIAELVTLIFVLFDTMLMASCRFGYSVSEQRMWKRKHKVRFSNQIKDKC